MSGMDAQSNKSCDAECSSGQDVSPTEVGGRTASGRRRILMQALAGAPVILTISAGPAHASHDGATNHETCVEPTPTSKKCETPGQG